MTNRLSLILVVAWLLLSSHVAVAALAFESGSLGSTGITWAQMMNQSVPGTNVFDDVFVGARFRLEQATHVTRIGGHFVGSSSNALIGDNRFFGAVVSLDSSADFPDSTDLQSEDLVAMTMLEFPTTSAEIYGALSADLQPGWYALVFGSGLSGTMGTGGAIRNGIDNGEQSYFGWLSGTLGWFNLRDLGSDFVHNHRFVVEGTVVPEPLAATVAISGVIFVVFGRRQRVRARNLATIGSDL